jgi:hypothetical protein
LHTQKEKKKKVKPIKTKKSDQCLCPSMEGRRRWFQDFGGIVKRLRKKKKSHMRVTFLPP